MPFDSNKFESNQDRNANTKETVVSVYIQMFGYFGSTYRPDSCEIEFFFEQRIGAERNGVRYRDRRIPGLRTVRPVDAKVYKSRGNIEASLGGIYVVQAHIDRDTQESKTHW